MKRLYALDSLRGLAALSVVFWHWQHFYDLTGHWQQGWKPSSEPLYQFFRLLYDQGWAAVDLFFPLSGFIFFWLYGESIRERRIGSGEFALLRFSRLWPLHTAMLLIAAVLLLEFRKQTGTDFIYTGNDWQHFFSTLFIAQQWFPPSVNQTFDGPAWSVSVEVLLYGFFFVAMRAGLKGARLPLAIAVLAIPFLAWNWFIARGVMGFFIGGAVFHISERLKVRADAKMIARTVAALSIALWAVVIVEVYFNPMHNGLYWLSGHISPALGRLYIGWNGWLFLTLFIFSVSPLTILALALHEQVLGGNYRRLSFLGDISYSTYLLHFPLQLTLVLIALSWHIKPEFFMSPFVMAGFFAVLIGLGALSFNYFERPLQSAIRRVRTRRPAPAE